MVMKTLTMMALQICRNRNTVTNIFQPDTDGDFIPDYIEVSPNCCLDPLLADTDGDSLDDGLEVVFNLLYLELFEPGARSILTVMDLQIKKKRILVRTQRFLTQTSTALQINGKLKIPWARLQLKQIMTLTPTT